MHNKSKERKEIESEKKDFKRTNAKEKNTRQIKDDDDDEEE